MASDAASDIRSRAFRFGCDVARFALGVAPLADVRPLADQLLKSGTAIGANLEEAKAGSSRREFVRFVEIALREAREALYWLRICAALELGSDARVTSLQGEADQLVRILTAIVVNTKGPGLGGVDIVCILNSAFWITG